MPGNRGANLRSGDLNEDYGIFLLKQVGAVAPVPRTEDVGIDAFVTLLPRRGKNYRAADTLLVQLKSTSVEAVFFDGDDKGLRKENGETAWLRELDAPLFFGSVSKTENGQGGLRPGRLRLYSSHNLVAWLFQNRTGDGVGVCFRPKDAFTPSLDQELIEEAKRFAAEQALTNRPDDQQRARDHIADYMQGRQERLPVIWLGEPAVEVDLLEVQVESVRESQIAVMRDWAQLLNTNRQLGKLGVLLDADVHQGSRPANVRPMIFQTPSDSEASRRLHQECWLPVLALLIDRMVRGTDDEVDNAISVLDTLRASQTRDKLFEPDIPRLRSALQPMRASFQPRTDRDT